MKMGADMPVNHSNSADAENYYENYYEDYWDRLKESARYHPANRFRYSLIVQMLRRHLKPGMRILDMGCGDARLLSYLKGIWPENRFFGCDISNQVVNANRAREKGILFFQADISASDFVDRAREHGVEPCDVIVSSEVIEHLENDQGLIKNAIAFLKPGGQLILTTQSGPRYRVDLELLHHLRHYRRCELEAMVLNHGFKVDSSFGCGFPILNLQKILVNLMFGTVMRATASSGKPRVWVRGVMALMYYAMRLAPRVGGPQLVVVARRPLQS